MLVDCQTCPVRDVHCAECMVTALTTIPVLPGDDVAAGPRLVPVGAHVARGDAAGVPSGHPRPYAAADRSGRPPGPSDPSVDDPDHVDAPLDRAERRAVSALLAAGLVTAGTANAARARVDPSVGRPSAVRRVTPPHRASARRAV